MTNLEKYEQIFCNTFHVDKERLYDNFTFEAVGEWDSLIHLSLITDIEDTFGVMFEPEDIMHYGSFENGIEILRRYGVEI